MKIIRILLFVPLILVFVSEALGFTSRILGVEKNYYLLVLLQQILAIFLPAYYYYTKKTKLAYLKKKDITLNNFEDTVIFIILGVCLQFIGSLANYPMLMFFEKFNLYPSASFSQVDGLGNFLLSSLILCLIPAVFEEALFRKFIFDDLRQYSKKTAILFSALFFAFAHTNFYNIGSIFLIGLTLGIMRARNYSLIHLMLCHFFVNFTGLVLSVLAKNPSCQYFFDNNWVLLLAVFIVIAALIIIKTARPPEQLEFNYYKRPSAAFLKSIYKIPITYIYFAVFIIMGIMHLF